MGLMLKEITVDKWEECTLLKTSHDQRSFVASNLYSIAEAKFHPTYTIWAIYEDDTMVGFVMYGINNDDGYYWIYRLMIDQKYQRKGYGKATIEQVINILKSQPNCLVIMIGFHPENIGAEKLYESVGFEIGEISPGGERLGRYYFDK